MALGLYIEKSNLKDVNNMELTVFSVHMSKSASQFSHKYMIAKMRSPWCHNPCTVWSLSLLHFLRQGSIVTSFSPFYLKCVPLRQVQPGTYFVNMFIYLLPPVNSFPV